MFVLVAFSPIKSCHAAFATQSGWGGLFRRESDVNAFPLLP